MPKIYFLACRTHEQKTGDAFLEVINTTDNEMSVTLETYIAEDYNTTARLIPLEGEIVLGIKESARDELQVIDNPEAFQKLPRSESSTLINCSKNFAIVQIVFEVKEGAQEILVSIRV
jgi:hypothetical protein